MRARNLRPTFDKLDTRIVLDSTVSGGTAVTGCFASLILAQVGSSQPNLNDVVDWSLTGTPTPVYTNPALTQIDH